MQSTQRLSASEPFMAQEKGKGKLSASLPVRLPDVSDINALIRADANLLVIKKKHYSILKSDSGCEPDEKEVNGFFKTALEILDDFVAEVTQSKVDKEVEKRLKPVFSAIAGTLALIKQAAPSESSNLEHRCWQLKSQVESYRIDCTGGSYLRQFKDARKVPMVINGNEYHVDVNQGGGVSFGHANYIQMYEDLSFLIKGYSGYISKNGFELGDEKLHSLKFHYQALVDIKQRFIKQPEISNLSQTIRETISYHNAITTCREHGREIVSLIDKFLKSNGGFDLTLSFFYSLFDLLLSINSFDDEVYRAVLNRYLLNHLNKDNWHLQFDPLLSKIRAADLFGHPAASSLKDQFGQVADAFHKTEPFLDVAGRPTLKRLVEKCKWIENQIVVLLRVRVVSGLLEQEPAFCYSEITDLSVEMDIDDIGRLLQLFKGGAAENKLASCLKVIQCLRKSALALSHIWRLGMGINDTIELRGQTIKVIEKNGIKKFQSGLQQDVFFSEVKNLLVNLYRTICQDKAFVDEKLSAAVLEQLLLFEQTISIVISWTDNAVHAESIKGIEQFCHNAKMELFHLKEPWYAYVGQLIELTKLDAAEEIHLTGSSIYVSSVRQKSWLSSSLPLPSCHLLKEYEGEVSPEPSLSLFADRALNFFKKFGEFIKIRNPDIEKTRLLIALLDEAEKACRKCIFSAVEKGVPGLEGKLEALRISTQSSRDELMSHKGEALTLGYGVTTWNEQFFKSSDEHGKIDWKIFFYEELFKQLNLMLQENALEAREEIAPLEKGDRCREAWDKMHHCLKIDTSNPKGLQRTYRKAYRDFFEAFEEFIFASKDQSKDAMWNEKSNMLAHHLYSGMNFERCYLATFEKFKGWQPDLEKYANVLISDAIKDESEASSAEMLIEPISSIYQQVCRVGGQATESFVSRAQKSSKGYVPGNGFDPLGEINIPHRLLPLVIETVDDEGKRVRRPLSVVTCGSPTKDGRSSYYMSWQPTATITPAFEAYVERCRVIGEKHLFVLLQNPQPCSSVNLVSGGYEGHRIISILRYSKENIETLPVIMLSRNSPFYLQTNAFASINSAEEFKKALMAEHFVTSNEDGFSSLLLSKTPDYFIPKELQERAGLVQSPDKDKNEPLFQDILFDLIHQKLFKGAETLTTVERQNFIEVFDLLLVFKFAADLNVERMNGTCKDAIDRGAAFIAILYFFLAFATESEDQLALQQKIRAYLFMRAVFVRGRNIDNRVDRVAQLYDFFDQNKEGLRELYQDCNQKFRFAVSFDEAAFS